MTDLTAKTTLNGTGTDKKRLLARFKNYLSENSQMIFAATATINGNPSYIYNMLGKK